MTEYFFTIPKGTRIAVGKGDDGWAEIGATSLGVDATPGQPVRLHILEGDHSRAIVLDSKERGIPHPFKVTFPNDSARLFAASIIGSEQEGKAIITTIELASPVTRMHPGVVADFPDPMRTGAGANARYLPEIGV